METSIPQSSIVAMLISGVLCFIIPVIAIIVFKLKTKTKISPVFLGAATFIIFALILEQILHYFCLVQVTVVSKVINSNVLLYCIYAAFAASIFEETGRLLAFRFWLKKRNEKQIAVMFGLGHGGAEAIIITGFTLISTAVLSVTVNRIGLDSYLNLVGNQPAADTLKAQIEAIATTGGYEYYLSLLERISAMMLHVGLSILVFKSVKEKKIIWYIVAIILHAGIDMIAVIYQKRIITFNILLLEGILLVFALAVFIFSLYVYKKINNGELTNNDNREY